MKAIVALLAAIFGCVAVSNADAQRYPTRPIRLIVPFTPGGGVDILSRAVAAQLYESMGQPIVVDNRSGAGGVIGFETAVRANPDGYTLCMVNSNYSGTSAIQKLPYDPINDIQPIIQLGETGLVLVVHPAMPVKSVKELIAYSQADPNKLNYGSVGIGSLTHLALELFKLETKSHFAHVAYKGGSPALAAVIGGEVQLTAISMVPTVPHVKAGRLRALAVTTPKRLNALPDVPAVAESVPGYEAVHWYGIFGPKRLSRDIVERWNSEVAKAMQTDEMKRRLAGEGLEPAGVTPEHFLNTIKRDIDKWKRVVKETKIT